MSLFQRKFLFLHHYGVLVVMNFQCFISMQGIILLTGACQSVLTLSPFITLLFSATSETSMNSKPCERSSKVQTSAYFTV